MSAPTDLRYPSTTAGGPVARPASAQAWLGLSVDAWGQAAVIAVLFAAVFWHNLVRLWLKTNPFTGEANWGHSCFVPLVGLYFLFVNRETLLAADGRPFVWGPIGRPGRLWAGVALLAVGAVVALWCGHHADPSGGALNLARIKALVFPPACGTALLGAAVLLLDWSLAATLGGLLLFVYGIWPGQNDYLKDLGMVVTLFGIVLLLCGPGVMRTAWFPIAFLICAIPWPGLVYSWVAEPLSKGAAWVAVQTLNVTGVEAMTSGTKIVIYGNNGIPQRVLNVAEACAGMRSLMTFISVAAAIAFLSARPLWQRLVMVASAVPIAIGCNVMRISGQGLLDHYVSPNWSESYAHQMVGTMMLIPAFLLILAVGWVLDQLFIEEADDPAADAPPPPPSQPAVVRRRPAVDARPEDRR
jgi:exosortase